MRVRVLILLLPICLLLVADGFWVRDMSVAAAGNAILLRLRVGVFDPLTAAPAAPATLSRASADGRPGLFLVQFTGPIQDEWYDAMRRAGLDVVTYIPEYAYLVWGDAAALKSLKARATVRWTGPYQPYYALHPKLARPESLPAEAEVIVQVYRHPAADRTVQAILARAGKVFRPPYTVLNYVNIGVRMAAADLTWLAALPDVVNVEPRPVYRKLDEIQGQIMAGNLNAAGTAPARPGYLAWLQGLGFPTDPDAYPIVDVTDDGIDDGDATPLHPDFYVLGNPANPDRLVYNYNWTNDALADGRAGHGNINASIVAGYNDRSGFPYQDAGGYRYGLGINPFGRVAGSKVFNNAGSWDTDAAPVDLLGNTYALGGRISTNSWGCGFPYCSGEYDTEAQEYDAAGRDARPTEPGNQEMIVVFAAGNDGDWGIGSPGTAKNVITVGAAENYRPTWTDGCGATPTDANNAHDIASFSSRGPTADGRTKPDLVAPGTHIQGAASQAPGYDGSGVCDQYMPAGQTLYAASSGTSHSAPAVAGAASLVYTWYQIHYGAGRPPSPALVKAYLVNATRYLTGTFAAGNLPSSGQGYGEVLLRAAFDDASRVLVDQSHIFAATGESYELQGVIPDPGRPFRVTLAWSDAPGPTIGDAYVNDLDLEVVVAGQTYRGNVFAGPVSVPGGAADGRNNVESVFLPAGQSGPFTVRVRGANIAGDGVPGNADPTDQDFALVIYNGMQTAAYLAGEVLSADGASRAAAGPGAVGLAGATVQATGATTAYTVTTDATGAYSMTVAPGAYTVRAWKYGYTLQAVDAVAALTDTVTTVNFTLTQTAVYSFTGQVTDAATHAPLSATVAIQGPFGDLITRTNVLQESGHYTFSLHGGPYTVTAEARLHQAAAIPLDLTADATNDFALAALTTDGILWGYVTNQATGGPVQGAVVQVVPGMTTTVVAGDGYYELQLPSGIPFTVTVSAPGYSTVRRTDVIVPQSNLARQDFALPTAHLTLAPPEGLAVRLYAGEQATATVTIGNDGAGELTFAVREAHEATPAGGGPDPFGYTYQDSRRADGPRYEWIDATDGVALTLGDDDETNIVLPFPFSFYGVSSTDLRVGNNGAALFGAMAGEVWLGNEALGTSDLDYLIAPFWDDIDSDTGGVYYKTIGAAPNRRFVVEWHDRPHYSNIGAATFELILYEGTNNVKFQYRDVNFGLSAYDYGASATVGIRGSGNNYLEYSYNRPALADGLAICFQHPDAPPCDESDIPWLAAEPISGAVAAAGSLPMAVRFDATPITATGTYTAFLLFTTNDPTAQPFVAYPVTLTVLPPPPELTVAKAAMAEQAVAGMPLVYAITVTNDGGPATGLVISDTLPAHTQFAWADHAAALEDGAVVWRGLDLAAGASLSVTFGVTVTCVPSGTLIVNDRYAVSAAEWLTPTTGAPVTTPVAAEETVADFTFGPAPALARQIVHFENLSRNAVRYAWDFGDGATSTDAHPSHTYAGRGVYTVTLTARNDCQEATTARPIVVEDYAVALTSPATGQSADPGQIVTYTLQLTNTGTLSDVIHLAAGGTTWRTTLSTDTVALAPGEDVPVELAVAVPTDARAGVMASVWVTAVSQDDPRTPAAWAGIVLTTTVNAVYGVALSAAVSEQEAWPGAVVTYTLVVTNTGNALDTIAITRTNAGWPTSFSWTDRDIAAGGWRTAQVYVHVPEDVGWGAVDEALIRASGQGGTREVTLRTFLPPQRIYLPLVWRGQP